MSPSIHGTFQFCGSSSSFPPLSPLVCASIWISENLRTRIKLNMIMIFLALSSEQAQSPKNSEDWSIYSPIKQGQSPRTVSSVLSVLWLMVDMELKKLHVGTVSYGIDSLEDVTRILGGEAKVSTPISNQRGRREISGRVKDAVFALAVCHNVTPTQDNDGVQYQASSPDEIAIVEWCAKVGLHLIHRDRNSLRLQTAEGDILAYQILKLFPFTSESKRMGIIVRTDDDEIWFYMKGADTVMGKLVIANDWMDEECANMAREGLRTLVIGRRRLTEELWTEFEDAYRVADVQLADRDAAKAAVVTKYLEYGLEILGITGVEDKLQDDVKPSLELLRNAGIRIWMLTGDKVETARCVAISSKLIGRGQYIHSVTKGASQFSFGLLIW